MHQIGQQSYPPPPTSAPPTQTQFQYAAPPAATAQGRTYAPPSQPGATPTPPPASSTPSYQSPPQHQQQQQYYAAPPQQQHQYAAPPQQQTQYAPPPQQQHQQQQQYAAPPQATPPPTQHGALPQHLRTPSGLSQASAQQFSPPPTYPNEGGNGGYPAEKQQTHVPVADPAGAAASLIVGAPAAGQFSGAVSTVVDDVGTFNGGSYRISHRDCNTILTVQLAIGCPIEAKPGMLICYLHPGFRRHHSPPTHHTLRANTISPKAP